MLGQSDISYYLSKSFIALCISIDGFIVFTVNMNRKVIGIV